MAAGHRFSGLTEKTPNSIQIGAGVFCVNVPEITEKPTFEKLIEIVAQARAEGRVLGATRGGGTFVATVETSVIEIDDMKHPLEGTVEVTSQEARFTGTTVELKQETMKYMLPMSHIDEKHGGMTMSSILLPSHYLDNVLWIGNMTSGGATAIMIYKALSKDGITLTFTDSGGATIPFNYLAHQPDPNNVQFAPFHIWFVEADETAMTQSLKTVVSSPILGMSIAQMKAYAEENKITIPDGVTKHADIANVINEALKTQNVEVDA